jgi:VIT1/CCC1 family predicted Fe2+/Mn2+ transporter
MSTRGHHTRETHRSQHVSWLRAGVLGANDGIVSTAALMMGVAAARGGSGAVLTAGLAGLVGGSMSMAAGEYVSVSSQRDAEHADLAREQDELAQYPDAELRELTEIYVHRGLDRDLAREVAVQLHDHDALGAHLRDELNLDPSTFARPLQAAVVSAIWFALGALIPLLVGLASPNDARVWTVGSVALVALAALGVLGARIGGARLGRASLRVVVGGGLAMALTALIGGLVGTIA